LEPHRLLKDSTLEPVDRAAGCLVLLYGQPASRIASLTISQITSHSDGVTIRIGQHDVPVPAPLGRLLLTLAEQGKPYTGTGTP
jgi:integrase